MTDILVQRQGKPDVRLSGDILAVVSHAAERRPEGDAWDSVTLLRRPDGNLVLITQRPAEHVEGQVGEAHLITRPKVMPQGNGIYGLDGDAKDLAEAERLMINLIMKKLDWSWLSKKLAAEMKWDIVRTDP